MNIPISEYPILGLILAGVFGLLIGIEREKKRMLFKYSPIGLRSMAVLSIFGYLIALTGSDIILALAVAGFFILSSEIYRSLEEKGTTTIFTALSSLLIGYVTYYNYQVSAAATIFVLLLLTTKKQMKELVKKMSYEEFLDFAKFGLLLFIIYPILPEKPIDPWGLIKLREVWKMVILISLFNFVGYVATKLIGKRGLIIAGLAGGLTSSTAVSLSMAGITRRNKNVSVEAAGSVSAATATMFIRVIALSSIISISLASFIFLPSMLSALIGYGISLIIWKKSKSREKISLGTPFNISDALKFGLLFGIILLGAGLSYKYVGEKGLYLVSIASGLTDVDAMNLTVSSLVESGTISVKVAAISLFLAIFSNQITKLFICFTGSKELGKYVSFFYFLMAIPWVLIFL